MLGGSFSSDTRKNMMKAFRPYLLAVLYSGSAGGEAIIWPYQKKMFLNGVIKREWVNMASKVGKLEGIRDTDVETQPTEAESHKLYNSISSWRSRATNTIRTVVASYYGWSECKNSEERKKLCGSLLHEDNFTCLKPEKNPPEGRFAAHILSRALTAAFWNPRIVGIATQVHTKEFFDPLPEVALVFVCICISHAIREYRTGVQKTEIFGAHDAASEIRFRKTFQNQCEERKAVLRKLHLRRVHHELGMHSFGRKV